MPDWSRIDEIDRSNISVSKTVESDSSKTRSNTCVRVALCIWLLAPVLSIALLEAGAYFLNETIDTSEDVPPLNTSNPRIWVIHATWNIRERLAACIEQTLDGGFSFLFVSDADAPKSHVIASVREFFPKEVPLYFFEKWTTTISEAQVVTYLTAQAVMRNIDSIQEVNIFHCTADSKAQDVTRGRKMALQDFLPEMESKIRTHFIPADAWARKDSFIRKILKKYVSFRSKGKDIHFLHKLSYNHGYKV